MSDAPASTSEKLLAEMGWVRQLARALIKDAAAAEDVAQDTWIVAAEREPDEEQPLRPWLARVVKNLVHTGRRSEARRRQREAAAEDGRTVRTAAELVEQVELQRAVADEVLALAEPYRSTVLLHFVDGLSSADIARRLEIPDGTVRRRLKVALDQLRDALAKRNDQPRRGWLAALAPFAAHNSPPASAVVGGLAMKKLLAIVICLLLLLAIGVGVVWHHRAARDDAPAGGSATAAARPIGSADPGGSARTAAVPAWAPQSGAPARRIAGRVVAHGQPVGGATVTLGFQTLGERGVANVSMTAMAVLQRVAEVRSAPDGTFDFGAQPAAPFTVSARAEGYAAGSVVVDNANPRANSDHLIVQLQGCSIHLSGVVSDASGGPISHASLSVDGVDGAETAADGSFRVCVSPQVGLGMPSVEVRVGADGYGTTHETVLAVADLRHDFLLVPEAILVGRVTGAGGEPVDGALVRAIAEPQEIPRHVASGYAYSDKDGRFRIARLAPGAFELAAQARGGHTKPVSVFARAATTSREIQLVFEPKQLARVRGHVFRANEPASGVFVQAVQGVPAGGTVSQADGSFELELAYGKTQLFVPPHNAEAAAELDVERPVVDDVRLDIKKAASVHGHVTRKGAAVAGAQVMYMGPPQATFFGPQPETRTDENGAYALELPAGAAQLYASDYANKAFSFRPIDVKADADQTMDIELDSAGEVTGTVVNESGAPVAGAYMRLDLTDGSGDMCESITDASGRFDCALLVGGEYRPTVTPAPGERQGFAPASGTAFATIQVPRDGVVSGVQLAVKDERFAIKGTVVDDTGAPMSDVHVKAMAPGDATMDYPSTLTDAAGRFEIDDLARGAYSITAHAADGSDGVAPDVAAGTSAVQIKLARAGAIDGTLTGFASTPTVFFIAADRMPEHSGRALVEGAKFSRAGLTPGRYMIEATAGADTDAVTVEVRAGETAHADLKSRGSGTIEGTVAELASHKPIAAMRCDAKPSANGNTSPVPPDPAFQAFTDAAGHFSVRAPIGPVRVFCFAPGGGPLSAAGTNVDVAAGAPAKVVVFSVRADGAPTDPGFMVGPDLPITVGGVAPGGAAAAAGLRPGDQLVTVDGVSLQGVLGQGAMTLIANHRPGTVATLGIVRGGAAQTIQLALGGR